MSDEPEDAASRHSSPITRHNPGLIAQLRELPRSVWILFGGTFVNRFGTFVMPFLALYLTRRGFMPAQRAPQAHGHQPMIAPASAKLTRL